jgi:hypothetical protein
VNHTTVAHVLNEAIWPDGVKFGNILLLVTDAAPFMKKSSRRFFSELP